jgi:hypothetical protein
MIVRTRSVVLGLGLAIAAAGVVPAEAQYKAPRTEHGHPDLQGNWTNGTLTPMDRPNGVGPTMSAEDARRLERGQQIQRELANQPSDPDRPAPPAGGDGSSGAAGGVGGYNLVYIEAGERVAYVNGEFRTSLITRPASGRVPGLTEEGRRMTAAARAPMAGQGQFDNPENRPIGERCILSFGSNAGPPMLPNGFYNNNYTIVQTKDHVMIMTEMIHDVRIVRLTDGPSLPNDIRPWFGDSRGYWDGETLVIETTNIHPAQVFRGPVSEKAKITERLTRVGDDSILYEFTVDDPVVFTEPWGGEVPFLKLDGRLYEYACHEGNYSLMNVLSGARYQERQASQPD